MNNVQYKIGDKVMVGRFFRELAPAEVVALATTGPIVRLDAKFREQAKGSLLMANSMELLPVDAPRQNGSTKGTVTKQATQTKADKPQTWAWVVGSRVLFGSKSKPIMGEIVRHGRVGGNYVVKALEDHGAIKAGSENYAIEAEIRHAPTAATPADAPKPKVRKTTATAQTLDAATAQTLDATTAHA